MRSTDRRSNVAFAFVLACVLLAASDDAAPMSFHSSGGEYTVDIPDGWVRIPDATLQMATAMIQDPQRAQKVKFDAGFQPPNKRWLTYPYVLVQVIAYPMNRQPRESEMQEIVQNLTGLSQAQLTQVLSPQAHDLVNATSMNGGSLDTSKQTFTAMLNANVRGAGAIRGFATGRFGNKSMVQVLGYSAAPGFEQMLSTFQQMGQSLRFDPSAAYSAGLEPVHYAIIGGIAAGVILLVKAMGRKTKPAQMQ